MDLKWDATEHPVYCSGNENKTQKMTEIAKCKKRRKNNAQEVDYVIKTINILITVHGCCVHT